MVPRWRKSFSLLQALVVVISVKGVRALDADKETVIINSENALLYEQPSLQSAVLRRLFLGEAVQILSRVQDDHGGMWGKVLMAPDHFAYIRGELFVNSGHFHLEDWLPPEVLRQKFPFGFALRGPGELFGVGLQFRYLPFSRLGFEAQAGTLVEDNRVRGYSVAYGVIAMLSLDNFSPFVETGTTALTISDEHSTLQISGFYINAGVEWIFRSGYFFGLGMSYTRSYNIQLAYDYSYAKASSGNLVPGNFGSFTGLEGAQSLQRINSLLYLGSSF